MEPYTIDPDTQWDNSLKVLNQFHVYRTAYKYVNSQPIHAIFIIPQNLPSGPRPLLVRFHGGGWTEGEAEASMRPFFLELALKHGAVIITPDYRLRPEHEMTDGIEDVRSFWKWIEDDVQNVLHESLPSIELDVANLLIGGESAGGYHTIQTALLAWTKLPIKVLFAQYPAADLASLLAFASQVPADQYPYSIVEDHLAALEPDKICARAKFGSRMHLMAAMVVAGRFVDLSGDRAWIDPMNSIQTAGKMPPILLYLSKEDESIPWEQTDAWADKVKRLQPDVPLYLTYRTGDHVFDKNDNMETPWLKEPLEFVQNYWPARVEVA